MPIPSLLLLAGLAHGGELVVDVKVPVRVVVDGEVLAEVYREGVLRAPWSEGPHKIVVVVEGDPRTLDVTAGAEPVVLLVGRTGVTIGAAVQPTSPEVVAGIADVRFRSSGTDRLLVQIDQQRVVVNPGKGVLLQLPLGDHPMTVRSGDGTSVFARGTLVVSGGKDLVVQVAEGTLPETAGDGVVFSVGGP